MVESKEFERAIDFGLLQYMAQLEQEADQNLNVAAASYLRMVGARQFVWTLRNLAESTEFIPRRAETPNLDHTV
jgi:hypothetical protein